MSDFQESAKKKRPKNTDFSVDKKQSRKVDGPSSPKKRPFRDKGGDSFGKSRDDRNDRGGDRDNRGGRSFDRNRSDNRGDRNDRGGRSFDRDRNDSRGDRDNRGGRSFDRNRSDSRGDRNDRGGHSDRGGRSFDRNRNDSRGDRGGNRGGFRGDSRPQGRREEYVSVEPKRDCSSAQAEKGVRVHYKGDLAEWTYKRLVEYIQDFEKGLDDEHEVGAKMVTVEGGGSFHIEDMGYWGPDIITFDALNNKGERVRLIQNVAQLNVVLLAMKKAVPTDEKPRRIGFNLSKKLKPAKAEKK